MVDLPIKDGDVPVRELSVYTGYPEWSRHLHTCCRYHFFPTSGHRQREREREGERQIDGRMDAFMDGWIDSYLSTYLSIYLSIYIAFGRIPDFKTQKNTLELQLGQWLAVDKGRIDPLASSNMAIGNPPMDDSLNDKEIMEHMGKSTIHGGFYLVKSSGVASWEAWRPTLPSRF